MHSNLCRSPNTRWSRKLQVDLGVGDLVAVDRMVVELDSILSCYRNTGWVGSQGAVAAEEAAVVEAAAAEAEGVGVVELEHIRSRCRSTDVEDTSAVESPGLEEDKSLVADRGNSPSWSPSSGPCHSPLVEEAGEVVVAWWVVGRAYTLYQCPSRREVDSQAEGPGVGAMGNILCLSPSIRPNRNRPLVVGPGVA